MDGWMDGWEDAYDAAENLLDEEGKTRVRDDARIDGRRRNGWIKWIVSQAAIVREKKEEQLRQNRRRRGGEGERRGGGQGSKERRENEEEKKEKSRRGRRMQGRAGDGFALVCEGRRDRGEVPLLHVLRRSEQGVQYLGFPGAG